MPVCDRTIGQPPAAALRSALSIGSASRRRGLGLTLLRPVRPEDASAFNAFFDKLTQEDVAALLLDVAPHTGAPARA